MNEGNTRLKLAEMGIDRRENNETAVGLYGAAREILPKKSSFYAGAWMNEGSARQTFAEMDVDSQENFNRSKKLYLRCISALEKLEDGWTYSTALLNLNSLLKVISTKSEIRNISKSGKEISVILKKR